MSLLESPWEITSVKSFTLSLLGQASERGTHFLTLFFGNTLLIQELLLRDTVRTFAFS